MVEFRKWAAGISVLPALISGVLAWGAAGLTAPAPCKTSFQKVFAWISAPAKAFYRKNAVAPLLEDEAQTTDYPAILPAEVIPGFQLTRVSSAEVQVLGRPLVFPLMRLRLRTHRVSVEDHIEKVLGFKPGVLIGSGGFKRVYEHPTEPSLVIKVLDPIGIAAETRKVDAMDLDATDALDFIERGARMYQREIARLDWLPPILERLKAEAPPGAPKLRVTRILNRDREDQIRAGILIQERVSLGSVLKELGVPGDIRSYVPGSSPAFEILRHWLDVLDTHLIPVMDRRYLTRWGFKNRFQVLATDEPTIATGLDYGGYRYRNISAEPGGTELLIFDP